MGMRFRFLLILLLGLTSFATAGEAVRTSLEDWKDADRNRVVPVKIYVPSVIKSDASTPVVLFSHGLGGSREGYGFLASYWAEHGYVVIAMQHPGSDSSVWRGKDSFVARMMVAASVENYVHRARDVKFAIDHLNRVSRSRDHVLAGKIDLKKIALGGHSFGAYTALAIAGQVAMLGTREVSFLDPRVSCVIAMSPSPPPKEQLETAFAKIGMPVYYLTGTQDRVAIQPIEPAERKIPFEKTTAAEQYLLVLNNADHMTFSGRGMMAKRFAPTIQQSTTAFLDAYLKKDDKAKSWLRDSFKLELKETGTFDWK